MGPPYHRAGPSVLRKVRKWLTIALWLVLALIGFFQHQGIVCLLLYDAKIGTEDFALGKK